MKISFREHHLLSILNGPNFGIQPIDLQLKKYFYSNKALGSKDRKFISEAIYGIVRWKALIEYLGQSPKSWKEYYEIFSTIDPLSYLNDSSIPQHIRVSSPSFFFELLCKHYGEIRATELSLALNQPAPTTIRINPLKTTREVLFEKWKSEFSMSLTPHSKWGIQFAKKINFAAMQDFKEGLFEVQDEGSQLVAELVDAKPGDLVMDYCAGAGGKTLAFAYKLQRKGQIYLHDVRPSALTEAKKRLNRAGIQNAQILACDAPHKNLLKKKMDWVLLDVPCTGTGTLRRNPDIKWKLNKDMLQQLQMEQREIFKTGLEFLNPSGHIVYATCSILPEENQEQVNYFLNQFNLVIDRCPFVSFPEKDGMDGFFAVVLKQGNF